MPFEACRRFNNILHFCNYCGDLNSHYVICAMFGYFAQFINFPILYFHVCDLARHYCLTIFYHVQILCFGLHVWDFVLPCRPMMLHHEQKLYFDSNVCILCASLQSTTVHFILIVQILHTLALIYVIFCFFTAWNHLLYSPSRPFGFKVWDCIIYMLSCRLVIFTLSKTVVWL